MSTSPINVMRRAKTLKKNMPEVKKRWAMDLRYAQQVHDFLQGKKLRDVKPDLEQQRLVYFDSKEDLHECFQKMAKQNLHYAPVYNPDVKRWVGLLDWKSFATYLVDLLRGCPPGKPLDQAMVKKLVQENPITLMELTRMNPCFPVMQDCSALELIRGFGVSGIHSRPIMAKDDPFQIVGMISQSDVVDWLAKNNKELGPSLAERTILRVVEKEQADLRVSKLEQIVSVRENTIMTEVLSTMVKLNITGIAVVDQMDKLVANISVSDLKHLVLSDNWDKLFISAGEFIQEIPHHPLVTCSPKNSLAEVIDTLAKEKVSRVYVTNSANEPKAVITRTDVMAAIVLIAYPSETAHVQDRVPNAFPHII